MGQRFTTIREALVKHYPQVWGRLGDWFYILPAIEQDENFPDFVSGMSLLVNSGWDLIPRLTEDMTIFIFFCRQSRLEEGNPTKGRQLLRELEKAAYEWHKNPEFSPENQDWCHTIHCYARWAGIRLDSILHDRKKAGL